MPRTVEQIRRTDDDRRSARQKDADEKMQAYIAACRHKSVERAYDALALNEPMTTEAQRLTYYKVLAVAYGANVTYEQACAIAMLCLAANKRGENSSILHQSAIYFGRDCQCAKCAPVVIA